MSAIAKATDLAVSLSSLEPPAGHRHMGVAVVDIVAGDLCRITSTGINLSNGAADDIAATVHGWALRSAKLGSPLTLAWHERLYYCSVAQTPGIPVYASATVLGGLDTAPPIAGARPVGFVLEDGKRIYTLQNIWQGAAVGGDALDVPQDAITDLAVPEGIANNEAVATLVALNSDLVLTDAKVNAVISALETAGVLTP